MSSDNQELNCGTRVTVASSESDSELSSDSEVNSALEQNPFIDDECYESD